MTASAGGVPAIFLEGITSDKQGNLYLVDIPHGRVLRYTDGEFEQVAQWDGEPNGLALRDDGHLVIADYKEGIVSYPSAGLKAFTRPRYWKGITPFDQAKSGAI